MSILATQTNFILSNSTTHFLEIIISAEQDEEFRMMSQNSSGVMGIQNESQSSNGLFSWVMEGLLDTFTGKKLQQIKINLPGNTQVPMTIRCTSSLYFNTNIKSKQCTDVITGDFELAPQFHGEQMNINWETVLGYGYDSRGNVAIGGKIPTLREMAINCTFHDKKNNKIKSVDVTPACCKIQVSI